MAPPLLALILPVIVPQISEPFTQILFATIRSITYLVQSIIDPLWEKCKEKFLNNGG